MFSYNNKISVRQLQILLLLNALGTGLITLPARVAEYAGRDAWFSVILAALVMIASSYMITTVSSIYPDSGFLDYSSALLTRPVGVVLSVIFAAKLAFMSAMELRFFGEIVRQTLLQETPFSFICIGMLMLSAYAAAKGYEVRARLAEILIILAFVPLLFIFAIAATQVDYSNLLPLFQSSPEEIFGGGRAAIFSFSSVELCLLAFPYLRRTKKARRAVISVTILIGAFLTLITVVTVSRFGLTDLRRQAWPVLEMMDTVDIPGSFIERQDAIMMSFWIISVFAIVNAGLFFSSMLLKDVCGNKLSHSRFILILIPVIFGLSFLPGSTEEAVGYIEKTNNILGLLFLLVLPFVLLITARIRNGGGKNKKA